MPARLSRRGLILGGAGAAATAAGGAVLRERLRGTGPVGKVPDVAPGRVSTGAFVSRARGGVRTHWTVARPPAHPRSPLPVLVVLHGLGGDHRTAMGSRLGLDRFLTDAVGRGLPPYAVASVDGGRSYWHRRPDGEDAGAMVLEEFLPLLASQGLRTDRVALLGWSMGGYAALRLGAVLGPQRCAAVVAESPALWSDGADASRSGFRDAAEYAEYTVFGHQDELTGIPVRIDCGTADPFHDATRDYVGGFPPRHRPVGGFQPGGHDMGYWRRMAPAQLRFVGRHLVP